MKRFEFAGKVCVLTGAASGIGAALATDLAGRGAILALVDRDAVGLEKIADAARALGAEVSTYLVDLSDRADRLDLAAEVLSLHGPVDLLINNAGVALGGQLHQVSMDDIDWLLEINLRSVITMTKAFLPQLMSNPGAHVVNLSSLFGLIAPPGQVPYATSKYAVRGFTEALRHEMRAHDVGVTVVHPGGVATNIAVNARVGAGVEATGDLERGRDQINARLTLPPSAAAAQILSAVYRRRPRLVITFPAKVLDRLALAPARYWTVLSAASRP
ncbi:MAG TPA: SDR family NAD(P)-dependent oxidoreductase [Micromonosporaceae bacterium]